MNSTEQIEYWRERALSAEARLEVAVRVIERIQDEDEADYWIRWFLDRILNDPKSTSG
jgi:hypothetical protein